MKLKTLTRRTSLSDAVRPSDWVFAGICLAAAGLLAVVLWTGSGAGDRVVFRQNGQIVKTVPLDTDMEVTIQGEYTNVFEISDGSVRVVYTDCPNHQCEHTGSISLSGASIVCVPNEASAEIVSGKGAAVDAATG